MTKETGGLSAILHKTAGIDAAPQTREQLLTEIQLVERKAADHECLAEQHKGHAHAARIRAADLADQLISRLPKKPEGEVAQAKLNSGHLNGC